MTLRQVFCDLREDCRRFNGMGRDGKPLRGTRLIGIALRPGIIALALYRLSHYLYARGHRKSAGLLYRLNLSLTAADLNPVSRIGPGCVIVHTVGTIVHGTIGSNALLFTFVKILPEDPTRMDLSGTPVIGNNVTIGSCVTILGSVRIADQVSIAPFSCIDRSIDEPGRLVLQRHGIREPINEEVI